MSRRRYWPQIIRRARKIQNRGTPDRAARPLIAAAARAVEVLEPRRLLSTVSTFPIPGADSNYSWSGNSSHIVAGPDGNLWFTDQANNQVDRAAPAGVITQFSLPVHEVTSTDDASAGTSGSGSGNGGTGILPVTPPDQTTSPDDPEPTDIVVGPDGALWFTETGVDRIGRITTDGTITEYQTPTADSNPLGLTAGTDGNLWFTESGANQVGRITPAGTITEFSLNNLDVSYQDGMVAGPGGDVWFVASDTDGNSVIARINEAGKVSDFPMSDSPVDLAVGADGNIWVATSSGAIDRVTPAGAIVSYPISTQDGASSITAGPDGALWFALDGTNQLGRITTQGTLTEFSVPDPGDAALSDTGGSSLQIGALTTGPDSNLWFLDAYNAQIGDIDLHNALLASGTSPSVVAGTTSSTTLASFTDFSGSADASAYTASIAWGDGTTSDGTLTANATGGFDVSASRDWALSDDYSSATVTITDTRTAGRTATAYSSITVTPPPATGVGISLAATAAQPFSGTVASFTGVAMNSLSSYSATIDWGDGHTSEGTLTANASGGIDVSGANTYASSGTFTVSTSLSPYPGGFLYPGGGGIGIDPIPVGLPIAKATPVNTLASKGTSAKSGTTTTAAKTSVKNSASSTGSQSNLAIIDPILPIDPLPPIEDPGFAQATGTMTVAAGAMNGTGYSVQASTTAPFEGEVASFALTDPTADTSHYHAEIDWSDPSVHDWFTISNAPSAGTITPDGQGGFTVTVSTTFTDPGWSHFVVKITDDRLGSGDAAVVGVAYGQLIVDSPHIWLPILESQGANAGSAKTPEAQATSDAASTTAASVDPVLSEQVTASTMALKPGPGGTLAGTVGVLTGVMAGAPKHADLHGTINWGDGTTSAATFVAGAKGKLLVRGNHKYADTGSYSVTVNVDQTLYNKGKATSLYPLILPAISGTAQFIKPGPITQGGVAIQATAGQTFSGPVASFTAPALGVSVNRVATVFWGDGSHSVGSITTNDSVTLAVSASHVYRKSGKYHVRVMVTQTAAQKPVPSGVAVPLVLAQIATTAVVA